ncbi:MAG: hypothetical protein JNM90_11820 [Burkholderiales bacterium]|nr:hypothetical protein [Burkholderiales bacterium]
MLLAGLAALLTAAGCAQRRAPGPEPAPPAPAPPSVSVPAPAPAPAATAGATAPPASAATSLNGYKLEVASRIHEASSGNVFSGTPPHLLRSVIVVSMTIDRSGNLADIRVLRDNGDAETVRSTLDSARRGAPYPRPAASVLRGGRVEFTESWLFRDDGRFQLRSLAEAWQN